MIERLNRHYLREEEFLDECYEFAGKAVHLLGGEWSPNEDCDDRVRRDQRYFLSTGSLSSLVFDSASIYSDADGLSLVKIILRSSHRVVIVALKRVGDDFVAEKISDRADGQNS